MRRTHAEWALLGLALGLLLTGNIAAAMFVAVAVGALELTAPSADQADARRRNQARRIR